MSILRKLFGSGIHDDGREEYLAKAEQHERKIFDEKRVLYNELIAVDQTARIFKSSAGKLRIMRGEQ